ncbi:hypothetical protein BDZ89DRAFT_1052038 [Hymenopellis radicata]|nr:hypothetical protein BDZ89DRAFT_1052038 [Hymenopellis radicata]
MVSTLIQIIGIAILEFSVVLRSSYTLPHGVLIGLPLAVDEDFKVLFVVVVFHQTFEGLGIGSRLAYMDLPVHGKMEDDAATFTWYLQESRYAESFVQDLLTLFYKSSSVTQKPTQDVLRHLWKDFSSSDPTVRLVMLLTVFLHGDNNLNITTVSEGNREDGFGDTSSGCFQGLKLISLQGAIGQDSGIPVRRQDETVPMRARRRMAVDKDGVWFLTHAIMNDVSMTSGARTIKHFQTLAALQQAPSYALFRYIEKGGEFYANEEDYISTPISV